MTLRHLLRGALASGSRVVEEQVLLLRCHFPEKIARLLPVIVLQPVVIVTSVAVEREWEISVFRVAPRFRSVRMYWSAR